MSAPHAVMVKLRVANIEPSKLGKGPSSSRSTHSVKRLAAGSVAGAAWTELTASAPACASNADCCVIMNGCLSQGQLVGLADFGAAGALWPYCDDECNDCIPPAVEVGCVEGVCVGHEVPDAAGDSPLRQDHCGTDDVSTPDPVTTFGCGG